MSRNKFDDLLRKKLGEDLDYDPNSWERLSEQLPQAKEGKRNFVPIIVFAAAAVTLALASILLIKYLDSEPANFDFDVTALEAPANELSGQDEHVQEQGLDTKQRASVMSTARLGGNKHESTNVKETVKARNEEDWELSTVLEGEKHIIQEEHEPKQEVPSWAGIKKTPSSVIESDDIFELSPTPKQPRISLGVSGGLNYGASSAGYMLGVNAKHSLGEHFFIDGTVAVMYNNTSTNVGAAPRGTAGRPAAGSSYGLASSIPPAYNLFYMQFNPSVGYKVLDEFYVSLGGDLQQMISPDNDFDKVLITQHGLKTFPALDVGFTGKAEVGVTDNVRAGLLFRDGLNGVFNGNHTNFVNRRYVQIQFKYAIPIR